MVQDNIFECLCSEDGYEHKKPMKNCFLTKSRDFSGGPVVKIPRFQCRGWEGSTPGPETETPHATQYGPKPKTKSTQFWFSRNIHLSEWKRNRQQTQLNKGTRKGQRMISTMKETQQGKTNGNSMTEGAFSHSGHEVAPKGGVWAERRHQLWGRLRWQLKNKCIYDPSFKF